MQMPGLQNRAPASSKSHESEGWTGSFHGRRTSTLLWFHGDDPFFCPLRQGLKSTALGLLGARKLLQMPGLQNRAPASSKPHKSESRMESSHGRIPLPDVAFCSCNKKAPTPIAPNAAAERPKPCFPFSSVVAPSFLPIWHCFSDALPLVPWGRRIYVYICMQLCFNVCVYF